MPVSFMARFSSWWRLRALARRLARQVARARARQVRYDAVAAEYERFQEWR
jgi:hypothetical protein